MRGTIGILLGLFVLLGATATAHAVPENCLLAPYPGTPTPPAFIANAFFLNDQFRVDIWRVQCKDGSGSALLARITPITIEPFV